MLRFIGAVYGPDAIHEAWEEFVLWQDDELEFDPETRHMQVFMPWFFHAWTPDPTDTSVEDQGLHGRSPTAAFLARRGRSVDPLLRRYLEACVRTPFSFHEILRCQPGVGFRARDLFVGGERDVSERSASRTFQVGDAFFGQVVACEGIALMEACGPHPIPPGEKIGLIELRARMEQSLHPPMPETLGEWGTELREAYLDITERLLHPAVPVLQNTDGDELVFHRLSFEIGSAREAFDALKDLAMDETEDELLESADRDGEGRLQRVSFAWKVAGNRSHPGWDNTVLGGVEIDGSRLVAEVNSAERAARFRRLVEDRLAGEARHLSTEIRTLEDLREEESPGAGAPAPPDEAPLSEHPEVRQRLREMAAAHYESWVSQEIPALGHVTPLEAVRTRDGREKVEALVVQIERDSRRMDPPLDDTVLRELRGRLGLSPAAEHRERVSFITLEDGRDLIVAYAVALEEPGEVASLILQRTPRYERILPPRERGVSVSYELDDGEAALLRRVTVDGPRVEIETRARRYLLDVSRVDPEERDGAVEVLRRMRAHGGFELQVT